MFTGIIEQRGRVVANIKKGIANRLMVEAPFSSLKAGESIAVNGVCLTLLPDFDASLMFDISPETLAKTNLGLLIPGQEVNLERAMCASQRFGGHYVSGHVDTTSFVKEVKPTGDYLEVILGPFSHCELNYLLPKGSITLDGVSLTINSVNQHCIHVLLVPHTLSQTNLADCKPGKEINVEFDFLTRIIAHQTERIAREYLSNAQSQIVGQDQINEVPL